MATITYDGAGPGKARTTPIFGASPRTMKVVTGQYAFDSSYPAGGEDISDIFNQFTQLLGLQVDDPTFSAGTGKKSRVNYSTEKLMLYDNAATPAEVAGSSDQSGATGLRFIAWGY